MTFLNISKILEPINHLLPTKVGSVQLLNNIGTVNPEEMKQVNGLGQQMLQKSVQEIQTIDTQEVITQHETVPESIADSDTVFNPVESITNIKPDETTQSDPILEQSVELEENKLLEVIGTENNSTEKLDTDNSSDKDINVILVDNSAKTNSTNIAETSDTFDTN